MDTVWDSLGDSCVTLNVLVKRSSCFLSLIKVCEVLFFLSLFSSLDGITIFRPSTFFIKILSSAGVQIQVQMKPLMQLSITVDHSYQNGTSGRNYHILSVHSLTTCSCLSITLSEQNIWFYIDFFFMLEPVIKSTPFCNKRLAKTFNLLKINSVMFSVCRSFGLYL